MKVSIHSYKQLAIALQCALTPTTTKLNVGPSSAAPPTCDSIIAFHASFQKLKLKSSQAHTWLREIDTHWLSIPISDEEYHCRAATIVISAVHQQLPHKRLFDSSPFLSRTWPQQLTKAPMPTTSSRLTTQTIPLT